jgi:hypothetical protein
MEAVILQSTSQDIILAFEQAKNTNAAIKKFLKNEVAGNAKHAKFAKSLRDAFLSKNSKAKIAFIEEHLPDYEPHFLVIARYAFNDAVAQITLDIVTKYAEDFNTTYTSNNHTSNDHTSNDHTSNDHTSNNGSITVTNKDKFKKIVQEVLVMVKDGIQKHELPQVAFITKVVLCNIFDKEVLDAVLPIIGK